MQSTVYTLVDYCIVYTVAEIESDDKIIKTSLLIIKIEYNRNTYKKKNKWR